MNLQIATDTSKNFIRCQSTHKGESHDIRWVRWGWVEDNIITKYTSLLSETGVQVTTFRSLQEKVDSQGEPTTEMQSVLIQR